MPHSKKPNAFASGFSKEKFSNVLLSQGLFFNISHTTIGATAFYSFLNSKKRIPQSKKPVTFVTGFSNEKFSNVLLDVNGFTNVVGAWMYRNYLTWAYLQHKSHYHRHNCVDVHGCTNVAIPGWHGADKTFQTTKSKKPVA